MNLAEEENVSAIVRNSDPKLFHASGSVRVPFAVTADVLVVLEMEKLGWSTTSDVVTLTEVVAEALTGVDVDMG